MPEVYAISLVGGGAAISLIGLAWLLVRYLRGRPKRTPLIVLAIGCIVLVVPFAITQYEKHFASHRKYQDTVKGELHVTLTGWNRSDYEWLKTQPDVVVLQMANADVTDDTLKNIEGMAKLKELDLNNTKITDDGLLILSQLPKLEIIRLKSTAITDDGFKTHLLDKASLKKLDLRDTKVKGPTKREWKSKDPDHRELLD